MADKVNIYPKSGNNPTIAYSDSSRPNIGVCFSGGGSRALTCAWGQMLGLKTLNLFDKIRYISSVSGGTWASSIYSYLPHNITDDDFLGAYFPPEKLSLTNATGDFNVNNLKKHSLGKVPEGTGLLELGLHGAAFLYFSNPKDHKWLWAFLVGKFVLGPYGLRSEGDKKWSSSKYFSLSQSYATNNFPQDAPPTDDFFFTHSGRPFVVMNNNIMEKVKISGSNESNIVQLPNQVTPVSGGAQGQTPDATIIGGGSVESYGYSSTLDQDSADSSPVEVTISQPYSLIDIVSTSSAFFAEIVARYIHTHVSDPEKKKDFIQQVVAVLKPEEKEALSAKAKAEDDISGIILKSLEEIVIKDLSFLDNIVPTYNYWPIGKISKNMERGYTDGGTLDNTGILGLLSQTDTGRNRQDPINLVVFDNTETPLEKKGSNIIAGGQAAPLFGIDFDTRKSFTEAQKDPTNNAFSATSLITVFSNVKDSSGNTPFDNLVNGLYASSCGASGGEKPNDSNVTTEPAFYQQELTTVANSLANITAGRKVNMIYIQNAKILNWQNAIGDDSLKKEIVDGQGGSINPFKSFKDFPYYGTATKIGLEAKESNTLSQMWAWATSDDVSPLKSRLKAFIDNA